MAIGKKLGSTIKEIIDPNAKKKKGKDFGHGLKEFFTSKEGVVTLIAFALLLYGAYHMGTQNKHHAAKG